MSLSGTEVGLPLLVVGFLVSASVIALITVFLRRRGGDRADLLGSQMQEMRTRAAAASSGADSGLRDAAAQVADARVAAVPDDATSGGSAPSEVAPADPLARDATALPDGWPMAPEGDSDAMADTFAWLQIAALVDAGQREQAVELLSTTMRISADEAELLVDGLTDSGGEGRPG